MAHSSSLFAIYRAKIVKALRKSGAIITCVPCGGINRLMDGSVLSHIVNTHQVLVKQSSVACVERSCYCGRKFLLHSTATGKTVYDVDFLQHLFVCVTGHSPSVTVQADYHRAKIEVDTILVKRNITTVNEDSTVATTTTAATADETTEVFTTYPSTLSRPPTVDQPCSLPSVSGMMIRPIRPSHNNPIGRTKPHSTSSAVSNTTITTISSSIFTTATPFTVTATTPTTSSVLSSSIIQVDNSCEIVSPHHNLSEQNDTMKKQVSKNVLEQLLQSSSSLPQPPPPSPTTFSPPSPSHSSVNHEEMTTTATANQRKRTYRRRTAVEQNREKMIKSFKQFFIECSRIRRSRVFERTNMPIDSNTFICCICFKSHKITNFLHHCTEHSHDHPDATLCVSCGNYFFFTSLPSLTAQFYYHVGCCLGDFIIRDEIRSRQRFLSLVQQHGLIFEFDERYTFIFKRSSLTRQPDEGRLPVWSDVIKFLEGYMLKMLAKIERDQRDLYNNHLNTSDDLRKYIIDQRRQIETLTENKTYLNDQSVVDDFVVWRDEELNVNEGIRLDDRYLFTCFREIKQLRARSRLDVHLYSLHNVILTKFKTNDELDRLFGSVVDQNRPSWLLEILKSVYIPGEDDCLDPNQCGFTVWLLALSKLLPASKSDGAVPDVQSNVVFAHVFVYEHVVKEALEKLSNQKNFYVLPNTCLCYNTRQKITEPHNIHRHLIVLFRDQSVKTSYLRSISALNKGGSRRTKSHYCLTISTKHHFFNTVHYVSREKTVSRTLLTDLSKNLVREAIEKNKNIDVGRLLSETTRIGASDNRINGRDYDIGQILQLLQSTMNKESESTTTTITTDNTASASSGNTNNFDSSMTTSDARANDIDDEDDTTSTVREEETLESHAANSEHIYVKEPVCSHFFELVSVLYPQGLTDFVSQKPLTERTALILMMKSRSKIIRRPVSLTCRNSITSMVIKLSDLRYEIGCTVNSHAIPYYCLTNSLSRDSIAQRSITSATSSEDFMEQLFAKANKTLLKLGVPIDKRRELHTCLRLYSDFDDTEILLPRVTVGRVQLLRNVNQGLLDKMIEAYRREKTCRWLFKATGKLSHDYETYIQQMNVQMEEVCRENKRLKLLLCQHNIQDSGGDDDHYVDEPEAQPIMYESDDFDDLM